jgi:cysteine desulfurase/selenocysteine lyase
MMRCSISARRLPDGPNDDTTAAFARGRLQLHYIRMPPPDRSTRSATVLREEFPILAAGPYLNHAAIGPWPRCAAEAMQTFAEENLQQGPAAYPAWIRRENELRRNLARLIGARSADGIALLKNTSEGISTVAWGLDWRRGDNLVLPRFEFPSNRLPWLAQAAQGVEVREVDIRRAPDAEAALLAAMDERTRLLSVSAVQWSDGFRLDLQRLGDGCRQRRVLFFVDAIQQLGALPVDVDACRIDFLAADAHKWLLGPEGIALFYAGGQARSQLGLRQQGWHMYDDPWNFQREDWTPATSARRFEAGSPNSAGQAALHASLGLLLEQGSPAIAARVLENTDYLLKRLSKLRGVTIVSSSEPLRRSGIVSFQSETTPVRDIYHKLGAAGCACAVRDNAVRLSPHFYQEESVLQEFVGHLADALR